MDNEKRPEEQGQAKAQPEAQPSSELPESQLDEVAGGDTNTTSGTTGRTQHDSFTITKHVDVSSPKLY